MVPGSNPGLTFSNFSCSRRPGVRDNNGYHSFESLCVLRQVGVQASMITAVIWTSCRQCMLQNIQKTGSNHVMRSNFDCSIVVAMKSGGGRRREQIKFSE